MKNKFKPKLSRIEEWRILNLVKISLQSRICVNMSWNCWHISNCYCRCPTDTESIWTQFFKVQISLKLFGNTFYSTKYTSFSVRAYWPGLLHQLWYVWNQSWDLIDPPLLSNVSNHSNVFISKEDIYNLQFCLNICKGDLQKV